MRFSGLAVAATTVLGACASGGAKTSDPAASPSASVAGTSEVLVATMVPTNASGNRITGKIRLVPARAGEYTAEMDLRGGGFSNRFGWAVRRGQCGENVQDIGTSMSYRMIETRGDGMVNAKVPLRISIPSGETHHIVIFPDATNRSQVVSCGVLSRE